MVGQEMGFASDTCSSDASARCGPWDAVLRTGCPADEAARHPLGDLPHPGELLRCLRWNTCERFAEAESVASFNIGLFVLN